MKIIDLELYELRIPLKKPFKTALLTVETAEETIIKINIDKGLIVFGEVAPTAVITGEINESTFI